MERYVVMVIKMFISGVFLLLIGVLNYFFEFMSGTGGVLISGIIMCVSSVILAIVINKKYKGK